MENRNYFINRQMKRLDETKKKILLEKVENIDWSILDALDTRETITRRGKFAPLDAVEIGEIAARRKEFEKLGLEKIAEGKIGAVMLAGGQGTRLGLDKPKGTADIGITRELYIFECLINNLKEVTQKANAYVPLYIMTSEANYQDTVDFFEKKGYFAYPKEYIRFFVQEMVPAVDFKGRILMASETEPVMSPNGNGGWYSSMQADDKIMADVRERGIEWLNVFAVDNVLQRIADPAFIGAVMSYGCQSGAKVVKKAEPLEKVGVLCTEDGKPSIAEYYELTDEMITSRKENGELTYGFGVILNYLFSLQKLDEILHTHMPIHVVEKKIAYRKEDGELVKPENPNGYKFETLVLDMVHLMDSCLPYEVEREKEFAPIKNLHGVDSVDTARELLRMNGVVL